MLRSSVNRYSGLCGLVGAVVFAAVAVPALGQGAMSETTVIGSPVHPDRVSAPVSYGDLDLTTPSGRSALHRRVERTATTLCRQIGEDHMGSTLGEPSCEQVAVYGAARQEHDVISAANARTYAGSPAPTAFVMAMRDTRR